VTKLFRNQQPLRLPDCQYSEHLRALDFASFPLVPDFTIKLKDTGTFGLQLYFHSDRLGHLASFPWWDRVDQDLQRYTLRDIPAGAVQAPYDDLEQGWQIVIFERGEHTYVLQGEEPCCADFFIWFRVPRARYLEEWIRLIRQFNPEIETMRAPSPG